MKKFLNYTLMFFAFGLVGEVSAQDGPWYFAEPPMTMDPRMVEHYHCGSNDCRLIGVHPTMQVRMTDGERTRVQWVDMYRPFRCQQGYCTTHRGDEVGIAHSTEYSQGFVPLNYYLVSEGDKDIHFYQNGTGPYAAQFPPIYVHGYEAPVTQRHDPEPTGKNGGDNLHCHPRSDACSLTVNGEPVELPRDSLPQFFDFADVLDESSRHHDCYLESCEDNNGNFMGLNPFFYE